MFEDPASVAKRNAVRSATERVQAKLPEFYSATTREIDQQMAKSFELDDKSRTLEMEKMRMETDKVNKNENKKKKKKKKKKEENSK